jgi:hypothetical protein
MEGKDFSCFKDNILIFPSHDETEQDQAAVERLRAVEIVELVEEGFKLAGDVSVLGICDRLQLFSMVGCAPRATRHAPRARTKGELVDSF